MVIGFETIKTRGTNGLDLKSKLNNCREFTFKVV